MVYAKKDLKKNGGIKMIKKDSSTENIRIGRRIKTCLLYTSMQAGPPDGSAEAWGLVNKFRGADDAIYRGRKRWYNFL